MAEFTREIKVAQAKSSLSGLYISLSANCFIAASIVFLLLRGGLSRVEIFVWLASVVTINVVRLAIARKLIADESAQWRPDWVLRYVFAGALIGGLSWSAIPIFFADFGSGGGDSYVVFIIAGISAGALIQNTAYSLGALAFLAPPLVAVDGMMLFSATATGLVVGSNTLLLTLMMVRSSFAAQREFIERTRNALTAQEMARSLGEANTRIIETNVQLEHLANTDTLTSLANRAAFNAELTQRLEMTSPGREIALILFDLDRFKSVNDTFGHKAGDQLLIAFATELKRLSRPGELIARLGGDEFAIIVTGADVRSRSEALAADVIASFQDPVIYGNIRTRSGTSAGIAIAPEHASDKDSVFACADLALYESKNRGRRHFTFFQPSMKESFNRNSKVEALLPGAIERGELAAEFQPQINMRSGKVIGFEGLVRWRHETLGYVEPTEIRDAAANLGLSSQLTRFMAIEACKFIDQIDVEGGGTLPVAIKLSPREFANTATADLLISVADSRKINPGRLEIEITEETLLDSKAASGQLLRLKEAGFRLAVDDFGMGHASLSYLIDMHVDRLKIDRRFVSGIARSKHLQALATALVTLSRSLEIDIMAEGVEMMEDARRLAELGCTDAQGFLFAASMTPRDAVAWLSRNRRSPAAIAALFANERPLHS